MTRVPTSVHAAIAAAMPATPAQPGVLADFLQDVDRLFVPPRPLPSPAERARVVAAAIDWSQPLIVIWVPGTSGAGVPDLVAERLRAAGGPAAHAIDYQATWQLRDSVPDGEATLRELLRIAATRRRPGQRIVLLGESQGAWIISSVLRDPALAAHVHRAGLVAHPALAPAHAHASSSTDHRLDDARAREFNDDADVVTREVGRSAERVLDIVDSFARLDIGRALAGALRVAVTDPGLIQALVASQLFRVRGEDNPHGAGDLLGQAVAWVLGASDASDPTL